MRQFTVGDSPLLELFIRDSDDNLLDLTNHTVSALTKINDEAHDTIAGVVSGDQVTNKGKVTLSLSPAILDVAGILELRVKVKDAGNKVFTNFSNYYFLVKDAF